MGIIRNIANLFKSTDAKLERIGAIEFELEQLEEVKNLVVEQYNTLSKAVECEDFMCKEDIRFTDNDYIRQLASIKSNEKSLLKELDILKSNEDVIHRYTEDKRAEAVKIVKSLYRSGKLDLSQYNHAAAEKDENGAVKYADVIVVTDSWELLLMKRSNFEDKHQGAFVIPGGHVDKGEDYETAAKRELLEETGISVDKLKADEHLRDITFHKVGEFIDKNAHIEYYLLRINNKEQVEILLDELETRDYNWVPREEIDNYQMVFNMKDNIKEIMGWDLLPNLKVIEKSLEEIEKAFSNISELYLKGQISDELYNEAKGKYDSIEKAGKKDLTKLKKIKKLFMREGKLVFGTFWVDDSINEYDESKVSLSAGPINEDISQGDVMIVSTKKRTIQGTVCGFSFDKKEARHWISLLTEEGKVEWVEVNSMTNYSMVSKFTQTEKYKVIKSLGGSTGAMLVEDEYGNKYVKKTGKDKDHIRTEFQALLLYKMLGIDVPNVKEFDKENGVLYTEYIQGNIPLKQVVEEAYKLGSAKEIIGQDFAVDALLGNWDVVGLEYDNILYGYNDDMHTGYFRVDVGGSLNKRAQGEDKVFGPQVLELDTLLDSSINPQTSLIFDGVNVQKALKRAIGKYESVKGLINTNPHISEDIKKILESRVEYMKTKIIPPKRSELNYKGKLYNVIPGYHPQGVVDFYERLNQDMVITEEDIEVLGEESESKWNENNAKVFFENYFNGKNHLVNKAIENGVSYLDLWALRDYTAGSGFVNDIVKEYTSSLTGNVNFDNSFLVGENGEEFEEVNSKVKVPINEYFETILRGIKSINHALESGKTSWDANATKLQDVDNVRIEIDKIFASKEFPNYSGKDKESLLYINELAEKFVKARLNNTKTDIIVKPDHINDIETEVVSKVKKGNPLNKDVINIKGFEGQNRKSVAKVKILCNAIAKLEDIIDPVFHVEGLLNRGIHVFSDKQPQFVKEHGTPNKYVMHQWGSSTSWNEKGYQHGTQLRIIGKGVHINSISKYEGKESEVLLRPFTLFKTISMKDTYEKDGKAEVHLMKII